MTVIQVPYIAGNFREVQNFAFFEGNANWDKLPRTSIHI